MPQLNVMATKYAGQKFNMSIKEYVKWRAMDGACEDMISDETLENADNWVAYSLDLNLWCQMTVAPVIVILNLYIFMRIIVGNENLRNTFGAVGFQAAVDVVFTGTALIIHDMLYIVYDGKPLAEGGIIKIIYTFTTASYNINAFNTSAILIHLALDRFLTIRFAHIADVTQKKVKNASFIIIAIFTGYCLWITVVHSTYLQYGFAESGETLKELYDIFWYQIPSMYIMTFLYSLVVITTSILYSLVAYLLYKQTKTSGGSRVDKKTKRNREITLLFFLSTLAYIILWFPEVSYAFFWQWRSIPCLYTYYFRLKYSTRFGFFMDWARELLFYIYSVVNPLLFIGTQKNFHPSRFHRDFMKKYGTKFGYIGRKLGFGSEKTDSKIPPGPSASQLANTNM